MYNKNLIALTFLFISSFALGMYKEDEPRLHYVKSSTTEVWIERMLFEGNGCQIIKKNVQDDVSFVINYIFDDKENHSIQSILLSPCSSSLFIVCKSSVVLFRLSTKPYAAMVFKKAKKGLNVQWGIVKDRKVYRCPSSIVTASFDTNMNLSIFQENGTITTLDLTKQTDAGQP